MQSQKALATFVVFTVAYLIAIIVADSRQHAFDRFGTIASALPAVIVLTFVSYLLRFVRWRWLLVRRGYTIPLRAGFLAYLAGFAYTATPGKVGELLRIRYFGRLRVPAGQVVACFVFERFLDLVVLLLFAMTLASSVPYVGTCFAFVLLVFSAVTVIGTSGKAWAFVVNSLRGAGYPRVARIVGTLAHGFRQALGFFNPSELGGALILGFLAWSIQLLAFHAILRDLGIALPVMEAFAISSAAMLIGAASMLPGGVGTTEAAMVLLLTQIGVSGDTAIMAAICMRLGTIWFAVLLGLVVVWSWERRLAAPGGRTADETSGETAVLAQATTHGAFSRQQKSG